MTDCSFAGWLKHLAAQTPACDQAHMLESAFDETMVSAIEIHPQRLRVFI
jgi:hypothetical protein